MLRDAAADAKGLENAVARGFRSLGFDVVQMGKSGEPDGLANANLGVRQDAKGNANYSIAYDAKSTKNERVQTGNVNIAGISRHPKDYKATFAVVVGKQFSDEKEEDSAVIKESRDPGNITLIEVEDFALLIETAATKRLGLFRLKDLFEKCCSPNESKKWINEFVNEVVSVPPIPEIYTPFTSYNLKEMNRFKSLIFDGKTTNFNLLTRKK